MFARASRDAAEVAYAYHEGAAGAEGAVGVVERLHAWCGGTGAHVRSSAAGHDADIVHDLGHNVFEVGGLGLEGLRAVSVAGKEVVAVEIVAG